MSPRDLQRLKCLSTARVGDVIRYYNGQGYHVEGHHGYSYDGVGVLLMPYVRPSPLTNANQEDPDREYLANIMNVQSIEKANPQT